MSTRLSSICEGLLEATWLLAVTVTPILFNIYSGRPFEANKALVLQILAPVAVAAWCVLLFERGKLRWASIVSIFWRESWGAFPRWIAVAVVVYLTALSASTVFSASREISISGSFGRLGGMLTILACVVFFVSILGRLDSREQLNRLLDVIVYASFPVCIYGFMQRFGLDPLSWQSLFSGQENRIFSTLGNPIFAGAYLVLILPVTVAHAVNEALRLRETKIRHGWQYLRPTSFWVAAAMQSLALYYTGSRGPWLGVCIGLVVSILVFAPRWNQRWARALAMVWIFAVAVVVILNLPEGPLERLRRTPLLASISHIYENSQDDISAQGRLLIWQGVVALSQPHGAIYDANGEPDPWNPSRPWIGYGPETLGLVSHSFMPAEIHRALGFGNRRDDPSVADGSIYSTLAVDSAHNAMFDSLATGGVLGVLAHLMLYSALFYHAIRSLGLIRTHMERRVYLLTYVGVGVAGAAFTLSVLGLRYLALGVPVGLVMGLIGYLVWFNLRGAQRLSGKTNRHQDILLIGLFSALLGQFVESQFGVTVVTSQLYFWILAGMLLVVSRQPRPSLAPDLLETSDPAANPNRGLLTSIATHGLLATAILVTLVFDFSRRSPGDSDSPIDVGVLDALHAVSVQERAAFAGLTLIALTWFASGVLLGRNRCRGTVNAVAVVGGYVFAAVLLSMYAGFHDYYLSEISSLDITTHEGLNRLARNLVVLPTYYIGWLLAIAFVLAFALPRRWPTAVSRGREISVGLTIFVFGGVFLSAILPRLRAIHADVLHHNGMIIASTGQHADAVRLHRRAISLAPRQDRYYLSLGRALQDAATQAHEEEERNSLLEVAKLAMVKAQSLSPLEPNHVAGLARLASRRAELAVDSSEAQDWAQEADQHYADSLRLSPNEILFWNEWARLDLRWFNDPPEAERKLLQAVEIDPKSPLAYIGLGELHIRLGRAQAEEQNTNLEIAARYFQEATALTDSLGPLLGLAWIFQALDEPQRAIPVLRRALEVPGAEMAASAVHDQLAKLYRQAGKLGAAKYHAEQALATDRLRNRQPSTESHAKTEGTAPFP